MQEVNIWFFSEIFTFPAKNPSFSKRRFIYVYYIHIIWISGPNCIMSDKERTWYWNSMYSFCQICFFGNFWTSLSKPGLSKQCNLYHLSSIPIGKFLAKNRGKFQFFLCGGSKFKTFWNLTFPIYFYYQNGCCVKIWVKTKQISWFYSIFRF